MGKNSPLRRSPRRKCCRRPQSIKLLRLHSLESTPDRDFDCLLPEVSPCFFGIWQAFGLKVKGKLKLFAVIEERKEGWKLHKKLRELLLLLFVVNET